MMTRKERKVQKALGTWSPKLEDYYKSFEFWVVYGDYGRNYGVRVFHVWIWKLLIVYRQGFEIAWNPE